jgi:hypothetical protein
MGPFGPSRPATQAADEKRRAEPRRPKDKLSNTKRTR